MTPAIPGPVSSHIGLDPAIAREVQPAQRSAGDLAAMAGDLSSLVAAFKL